MNDACDRANGSITMKIRSNCRRQCCHRMSNFPTLSSFADKPFLRFGLQTTTRLYIRYTETPSVSENFAMREVVVGYPFHWFMTTHDISLGSDIVHSVTFCLLLPFRRLNFEDDRKSPRSTSVITSVKVQIQNLNPCRI